jgi:hypothetical protein
MSRKSFFGGVLLLLLWSTANSLAPGQISRKKIPQINETKKLSPKVDKFLQDFERAKSFDEVMDSYQKAGLTDAEVELIRKEITKTQYKSQIQNLTAKDVAIYRRENMKIIRNIPKEKQSLLDRQNDLKLRQSNQTAISLLTSIKAKYGRSKIRPGPSDSSESDFSRLAPPSRPSGENLAHIESISPRSIMVGQEFYITGERFGRQSQGKIYLTFGGNTYECSIRHWMDNEIRAIIPQQLNTVVREFQRSGQIYIQPFGRPREATATITILPNPRLLIPRIGTLSDSEIRRGQLLIIEGENFLNSRGTVEFRFGTKTFTGRINEWDDRYIAVELQGGITGLPRSPGIVSVTNMHGGSANKGITFVPNLIVMGLQEGSTDLAFFFMWIGNIGTLILS